MDMKNDIIIIASKKISDRADKLQDIIGHEQSCHLFTLTNLVGLIVNRYDKLNQMSERSYLSRRPLMHRFQSARCCIHHHWLGSGLRPVSPQLRRSPFSERHTVFSRYLMQRCASF